MFKSKVLIVEDEQMLSEAYQIILGKEGFETAVAFDGDGALLVAETFKPDLILLDLRMPKAGGIDFLKQYRQETDHPRVKIIVFSNLDSQKEIDEAYSLGTKRYILKAWASPNELVKIVNETLETTS